MTRAILVLTTAVMLCGCATTPQPEPVVITKEVKVLVPIPCDPKIDAPKPDFDAMKRAVANAPNIYDRGKTILQYAVDLTAWASQADAGLKICAAPQVPDK